MAWKLVATNMSDLAAKGARPIGVLLSYQLGADDTRFAAGLAEALSFYHAELLGGDTVGGAGPQHLGLTAFGAATTIPVPSRSGARPGDGVWISGPVGAAMLGLEALKSGDGDPRPYVRPIALMEAGIALAPLVSAMMDVSDGLLLDCSRMAQASAVTIDIQRMAVPIAADESRRSEALTWGDDYQLLFTAAHDAALPVPAHRIGSVLPPGRHHLLVDGSPPRGNLGYQHG